MGFFGFILGIIVVIEIGRIVKYFAKNNDKEAK